MTYFSRLTDIVTCNLSHILAQAADPVAAIADVIREMQEGLAGAHRSVDGAVTAEQRLLQEIQGHQQSVQQLTERAKTHLLSGAETEARQALLIKRETEDLIAGLQQQHQAAIATRDHLQTLLRALEARLAEACRRRDTLGGTTAAPDAPAAAIPLTTNIAGDRIREVDAELEALKRSLGQA